MPADTPDAQLDVPELAGVLENFTRMFIRLPAPEQLSYTTLSVLDRLAGEGPSRLAELTAAEQVTQSAITQLIIKLERRGYVRRTPDPSDRRAVLVDITSQGTAIVKTRQNDRIERIEELLARLDGRQTSAISNALPALSRMVEAEKEHES